MFDQMLDCEFTMTYTILSGSLRVSLRGSGCSPSVSDRPTAGGFVQDLPGIQTGGEGVAHPPSASSLYGLDGWNFCNKGAGL